MGSSFIFTSFPCSSYVPAERRRGTTTERRMLPLHYATRHKLRKRRLSRMSRISVLVAANWLFWLGNAYASWNHLIPERLVVADMIVSLMFAVPLGCCSLPFLVVAQLHDTGWRIVTYGGLTLANGVLWAWLIDLGSTKLSGRPEALDDEAGGGGPTN